MVTGALLRKVDKLIVRPEARHTGSRVRWRVAMCRCPAVPLVCGFPDGYSEAARLRMGAGRSGSRAPGGVRPGYLMGTGMGFSRSGNLGGGPLALSGRQGDGRCREPVAAGDAAGRSGSGGGARRRVSLGAGRRCRVPERAVFLGEDRQGRLVARAPQRAGRWPQHGVSGSVFYRLSPVSGLVRPERSHA